MEFETLLWERQGQTVCITLNRPDRLNALNDQMTRELATAFTAAEADPEIWTIILTGSGRALCTGADIDKAADAEVDGRATGIDRQGEPLLASYRQWDTPQEGTPPYLQMTKPIVCAVNGMVAGAGLDFVTTSDIVIAAEGATFFDPHVSIGLVSGREVVRLARVLPLNIVMRVALMGKHERLSAERAYQLGLVSELMPGGDLLKRAWEIAGTINLNAPLAVRGTRLAIRKGLSLPIYEAELLAESYRMRVAQTADAQEGPRAFMEKRQPLWQVR